MSFVSCSISLGAPGIANGPQVVVVGGMLQQTLSLKWQRRMLRRLGTGR
jgi:hypothetical protein